MSARGEQTLLSLLTDFESLETLAVTGLPPEAVPTVDLRRIVTWATDYYFNSQRTKAPTPQALQTTFGELLSDNEIELLPVDEAETMEWAITDLKVDFGRSSVQNFTREFATATSPRGLEAEGRHALDIPSIIHEHAGKLLELDLSLADNHHVVPVGVGLDERIAAYEQRVREGVTKRGLFVGVPSSDRRTSPIDDHFGGIHPGEVGVIGAGAKVGKSFILALCALTNWERGYPVVLFTLENNKEMTLDRIACLGAHVDGERFERGTLSEDELDRIRAYRTTMNNDMFVVEPSDDERTPQALYRQTQLLGGEAMIVDQLPWVKHPKPDSRRPRNAEIADIMRMFKVEINRGNKMSLLLAHQIKRDGIEAARKRGYHDLTDFADSSEVERAIDMGWALYASRDNQKVNRMLFHSLAARRATLKHWTLGWQLQHGAITVFNETELPSSTERTAE